MYSVSLGKVTLTKLYFSARLLIFILQKIIFNIKIIDWFNLNNSIIIFYVFFVTITTAL